MKLIKSFEDLNNLREEMGASVSRYPERTTITRAKFVNNEDEINMPKLTDMEYQAYALENYPYCLNCQAGPPGHCDCESTANTI
jgi:hypothetical protein